MTQETYKYRFDPETVPAQDMEDTLMLALLAVECLHSRSRVRMEGRFTIDKQKRTCTIDATTSVGRDLAHIFTGFVISEYGERAVCIKRIASSACGCVSKEPVNAAPAVYMTT
jgi:hypothetical protein